MALRESNVGLTFGSLLSQVNGEYELVAQENRQLRAQMQLQRKGRTSKSEDFRQQWVGRLSEADRTGRSGGSSPMQFFSETRLEETIGEETQVTGEGGTSQTLRSQSPGRMRNLQIMAAPTLEDLSDAGWDSDHRSDDAGGHRGVGAAAGRLRRRCSINQHFGASVQGRMSFRWSSGPQTGRRPVSGFGRTASSRVSRSFLDELPKSFQDLQQATCVINPERSIFLQRWDKIIIWAILFVVVITPVEVAMLNEESMNALFFANILVDLTFFLDLLLQFCIMFPKATDHGSEWESRPSAIAIKYLKTWFAIDVISLAPIDKLARALPFLNSNKRTLKAIRVLQLLKLTRVFRLPRLHRRFQLHMSITYKELSLVRFFVIMTIQLHWLTCLWAFTLVLVGQDENVPRWIDTINALEVNVQVKTIDSVWKLYVCCLYFCSYTMNSIGYGDIGPKNIVERLFCCYMIISSGIAWAMVLGQVSGIVANLDTNEEAFRSIMDDLQLMMRDRRMDADMSRRIRNFFTSNKTAQRRARHRHILDSLSPGLQGEVILHLNNDWIARVDFLCPFLKRTEDTDGGKFRGFLADVSQALHSAVFAQSEVFGVPHVLYILNCGLVSRDWRLYHRGAVWGNDFVLADPTLVDSLQSFALTYVETLTLNRQDFFQVVDAHRHKCPDVKRCVRRICCWLALQRAIMKEARRRQRDQLRIQRTGAAATAAVGSSRSSPSQQLCEERVSSCV